MTAYQRSALRRAIPLAEYKARLSEESREWDALNPGGGMGFINSPAEYVRNEYGTRWGPHKN